MKEESKITGCVLAGGKSSRFGSNKALQLYDGHTFLDTTIRLLCQVCDEVAVSVGNKSSYPDCYSALIIEDQYKDCGPLGGIFSVMTALKSDYYLFMPCDMPFMTVGLLRDLINKSNDSEMIFFENESRSFMFPMLLRRSVLGVVSDLLGTQIYKLKAILPYVNVKRLDVQESNISCFANINTPNDFQFLASNS